MKKHLLGIAVAMAVAGLISLISARRIEAQFSSPVKIVNTTSAPAITSRMDDPGRIPYQSTINGPSCVNSSYCNVSFPAIPSGHRLVVTQISGAHNNGTFNGLSPLASESLSPGPAEPTLNSIGIFKAMGSYVLPVSAYLDAGMYIALADNITGTTYDNGPQLITVTGYMLDCSAAPCGAIAQ